jgi:SAM-dependent methyltransferase
MFAPLYEAVFDEVGVRGGTRLLDVGCGPGLGAKIAAARGARVAGLDGAAASLVIARERTPQGDFQDGALEDLPWSDGTFDVVTGFNSFQFAADIVSALREARRVVRPGGRVAAAVWGRDEDCETVVTMAAVRKLLAPPPSPSFPLSSPSAPAAPDPPLSVPGRIEALMARAGLTPLASGAVDCSFEFPDLATAVTGIMSAGAAVAAARQLGAKVVRQAIAESLAAFRTGKGTYRQRNRFRYVIAVAGE